MREPIAVRVEVMRAGFAAYARGECVEAPTMSAAIHDVMRATAERARPAAYVAVSVYDPRELLRRVNGARR